MSKIEKTSKEILTDCQMDQERIPLYNPDALEKIRQEFNSWMNLIVSEKDRDNWLKSTNTVLGSNIPREMLYTPLSDPNFDYQKDLAIQVKHLLHGESTLICIVGGSSLCDS